MRRRGQILATLTVLSVATSSAAQERGDNVRFAWVRDDGAESCPDASMVRRAVSERVGRDPFNDAARTSIDAVVRRSSTGFSARFFVRGATGESLGTRELTSAAPTCEPIAEALALALAIVIDPTVALRPDPTTNAPRALAPTQTTSRPPPSRAAFRAAPEASPLSLSLSLSFAGALGVLPFAAVGASLEGELRFSRWIYAELAARWLAEQRVSTSLSDYALSIASSMANVCVDPLASAVDARASFVLCGSLSVGALSASATRQRALDGGVRAWVALGPSARGRLRIVGPLALEARFGATFALARNAYVEEIGDPFSSSTVFEQPLVGGHATLGIGVVTDPTRPTAR